MKKISLSLLSVGLVLALAGCDSDDIQLELDPDLTLPEAGASKTITAIDGYLENAQVSVDTNSNFILDEDDLELGRTDEDGKFEISADYADSTIFVTAIANETVDLSRGLVLDSFTLGMTGDDTVASPITNLVVELLSDSPSLEPITVKDLVAKTFDGLDGTADLLFSDYLAVDSEAATAITILGERLVDHSDLSTEKRILTAAALADNLQTAIENSDEPLTTEYSPAIIIPEDPSQSIEVISNYRPVAGGTLGDVNMYLSDDFSAIDLSLVFSDKDLDQLTFTFTEINGLVSGLSIDSENMLFGTITNAGDYVFELVATDSHGAESLPVTLNVNVTATGNDAPVVSTTAKDLLQADIDTWYLQESVFIDYIISLTELFEDNDAMTYRIESSLETNEDGTQSEFAFEVFGQSIYFNSAPLRASAEDIETITVWASDGVNAKETSVTFTLPEIFESDHVPDAPTEPTIPETKTLEIEDTLWHYLDVEDNVAGCFSVYFDSAEKMIYSGVRNEGNSQGCSDEIDMENGVGYTIDNDIIYSENYANDGISYKTNFVKVGVGAETDMVVTATKGTVGTDSFEEVALGLQDIPNYTEYALANTPTDIWGSVSSQFYNSIENDFFLFGAMLYEEVVDGHTISTVALLGSNDECDALENTYKHAFTAFTANEGTLVFDDEPIVEEIYTNSCKLSYSRTDNPFPKEMITILAEPTGGDIKLDSRIIFSFDNQ